jgi:hypothetical protein
MVWLLLFLVPVTVFAGLDLLCRGEPPAALRRLSRIGSRAGRRPAPPPADVFDTLWVQSRLGAVADEILRLHSEPEVYARAARLRAARRAYDDLLADACRLAGVGLDDVGLAGPVPPQVAARARLLGESLGGLPISDAARTSAELELAARGWSW